MKDVVIRGIRVPSRRAKFALVAAALAVILGLVGFCLALSARSDFSVKRHFLTSYFFLASRVLGLAAMLIAAPKVLLPLALIVAPFFVAVFAMEQEPWLQWWFWPGTGLLELVGAYALLRLASPTQPNKPPEPTITSVMPAAEQPSRRP